MRSQHNSTEAELCSSSHTGKEIKQKFSLYLGKGFSKNWLVRNRFITAGKNMFMLVQIRGQGRNIKRKFCIWATKPKRPFHNKPMHLGIYFTHL